METFLGFNATDVVWLLFAGLVLELVALTCCLLVTGWLNRRVTYLETREETLLATLETQTLTLERLVKRA